MAYARETVKAERQEAKAHILSELEKDRPMGRLGLHKGVREMIRVKVLKGESVIPRGMYCYDERGNCPYWDKDESKPEQCNGFCWFLVKGDQDEGMGELWDQCKCCGINDGDAPEGSLDVLSEESIGC